MDAQSLAEREKALEELKQHELAQGKGIGLRLDILDRMIDELNADDDLKKIYGTPVSSKLAVFSDGKDISIVDAGIMRLNEDQKLKFLLKLKAVYDKTLTESFQELKRE